MANWYGTSRTNYFRVKSIDAFKAYVAQFSDIQCWEGRTPDAFALGASDEGYWPSIIWKDEADAEGQHEDEDVDFFGTIATEHLADDDALIVVTAGAEKLRYVTGLGQAYNSKGDVLDINISDIVHLVHGTWGIDATSPEY